MYTIFVLNCFHKALNLTPMPTIRVEADSVQKMDFENNDTNLAWQSIIVFFISRIYSV